jgi:hypothetical protein
MLDEDRDLAGLIFVSRIFASPGPCGGRLRDTRVASEDAAFILLGFLIVVVPLSIPARPTLVLVGHCRTRSNWSAAVAGMIMITTGTAIALW